MDDAFRTFCHISEYGTEGYENLHRMIATSSPLVLWAPSSELLIHWPGCAVNWRDFVGYVESGAIRVIGRRAWLADPDFRNKHPWEGARWNPEVDDELRRIAEDESKPRNERHVVITDGETGERRANDHLAAHPEVVGVIGSALTAPDAELHMPVGVVETARRTADDPVGLARRILRDAYNHYAALEASGARAPFLLTPRESTFMQLLDGIRIEQAGERAIDTSSPLSAIDLAALTREVLLVLHGLDSRRTQTLGRFVGSDGHQLLVQWIAHICRIVVDDRVTNIDGKVLRTLQYEFDHGRIESTLRELLRDPDARRDWAGVGVGVLEALGGVTPFGMLGLLIGGYGVQRDLRQRLGRLPAPYTGPQWPFLYTFGNRATGRQRSDLGGVIDRLAN